MEWLYLLVGVIAGMVGTAFGYRLGYNFGRRDAEQDFADRVERERRASYHRQR
jgi:membrane protein YqaA with SNARE-associated domain